METIENFELNRCAPQPPKGRLKSWVSASGGSSRHSLTYLEALESECIHILREVAAECGNPALLFSGGKDSIVLLRLAEKAFRPARFPSAAY
jgi:3'-phosphoadenosine 5'-phosphosulfate sulfotransferase (PAPS reductase)/FAD synthetase